MIEVNGKELDEHGLRAKAEARRRAGLYDDRSIALLERDIVEEIEEHVFSMIQVVYDLQLALEGAGAHLEPPADLSGGESGESAGRGKSLLRRLQTRSIRAINEGYVQQQEKFNTFFTKSVDLSYRQLCGAMGGIEMDEAAERRDLWESRRPEWESETSQAVAGIGEGRAVMLGIPGFPVLELLHERRRLLLAVDTCDAAAAESQAHFLPAWFHPRPMEVFSYLGPRDLDLAVVAFPECLAGDELRDFIAWAGYRMIAGGVILAALNRGWSEPLRGDPGFVRFWPRRLVEALMRRSGFEVQEWEAGGRLFLKGEKGA